MSAKYRHLLIEDAKGSPAPEEIAAVEALIGRPLPRCFLDFLDVANGGYLAYCIRLTPDGRLWDFCNIFLAGRLEDGSYGYETFVHEIESERIHREMPDGVLPFADDGAESALYLDLRPEGGGRVLAWAHGLPEGAGRRVDDKFTELAPSFDAYLEMLFDCEDEA